MGLTTWIEAIPNFREESDMLILVHISRDMACTITLPTLGMVSGRLNHVIMSLFPRGLPRRLSQLTGIFGAT